MPEKEGTQVRRAETLGRDRLQVLRRLPQQGSKSKAVDLRDLATDQKQARITL